MHRIDTGSAGPGNSFINGTVIGPEHAQAIQEEIAGVVEGAGDTLDKLNNAQLAAAIATLISSATAPLQAQIDALENFGNAKGARSNQMFNGSFPDGVLTQINWGAPQYDDLGFYNGGADRFDIPAGVDRVDISFSFACNLPTSDRVTTELWQNGFRIGSNVSETASSNQGIEGGTICVVGVPVNENDFFRAFVQPEGADISSGFSGHFSIQARKFA